MNQKPPIDVSKGEWEHGLWWTILLSAGVHAALFIGVLLLPQNYFLQPAPELVSYSVDIVDPSKLGGTNLIDGGKSKVQAPALVKPQEPPPAEPPKPPEPAVKPPEPEQVAKIEPAAPQQVPDADPDDPDALAVKLPATFTPTAKLPAATATTRPSTPTIKVVAKAPTATPSLRGKTATPAPKKTPTLTKQEIAALKKAAELEKKKAAEEEKKKVEAEQLKKALETARAKAEAEEKKRDAEEKKRQAEAREIDAKIMKAIQQRGAQEGVAGGGESGRGSDRPGGPLAIGPGQGVGGQTIDAEFILYKRIIEDRVRDTWHWAGNPELSAEIFFTVSETGEVLGIRIARPSGDKAFDAAAERAIRGINPLPPPPEKHRKIFAEEGFLMDLGKQLQP